MRYLLIFVAFFAIYDVEYANAQVCLDYWLKGPSACKQEKQKKIIINGLSSKEDFTNIEKDEARLEYEKNLNVKVDKFLENYGKPPREFVAFHLDPTMENAVRWVKKFNTEHERTMKIAVAWKQADKIFQQYRDTGQLTLPAESGVSEADIKYLRQALDENPTDLPEVKGFGVPLEGGWDEDRLSRNYAELKFKDEDLRKKVSSLANTPESKDGSNYRLYSSNNANGYKDPMRLYQSKDEEKNDMAKIEPTRFPIEVNYYFSKKCPFCMKFNNSIKETLESIGKENIILTCVDMTPGEKTESNKGDLDCKWRPILEGEAKQFGISKTPSLLVKRKGLDSLELLENYHNSQVLEKYLRYGSR